MRIAVTGANGRVGKAVVDMALGQGHEVIAIVRARQEGEERAGLLVRAADVTDYQAVEAGLKGCDAVVHMAAIPSPNSHPGHVVHNNNVVGNYNVLEAAAKHGIKRVCLASSINATGAAFSRWPRYDYFPLDELHPTYNEDPYALSKWLGEAQADSFARRYEDMVIASLRFHWVTRTLPKLPDDKSTAIERRARDLWGYVSLEASARASLLSLQADFKGHEVFYIVAPRNTVGVPALELRERCFSGVPLRADLPGDSGFYNCDKARRLLGWSHDE